MNYPVVKTKKDCPVQSLRHQIELMTEVLQIMQAILDDSLALHCQEDEPTIVEGPMWSLVDLDLDLPAPTIEPEEPASLPAETTSTPGQPSTETDDSSDDAETDPLDEDRVIEVVKSAKDWMTVRQIVEAIGLPPCNRSAVSRVNAILNKRFSYGGLIRKHNIKEEVTLWGFEGKIYS